MIFTMETCCTFRLKILYFLKIIVSVCKCLPPLTPHTSIQIDYYYYLFYSRHIEGDGGVSHLLTLA